MDLNERVRHAINVDRRDAVSTSQATTSWCAPGKLHITGDIHDAADCDYFIVTVGTPLLAHIETDLSYVTKVIASLCEFLLAGPDRSSCAARRRPRPRPYVARLIETRTLLKVGRDVMLACCPERIVEGKAREELHQLAADHRHRGRAPAHSRPSGCFASWASRHCTATGPPPSWSSCFATCRATPTSA